MTHSQSKKPKIRPVLSIVTGACSFLMLYDPAWFVGFGLAVAALILGIPCLKNEDARINRPALVGIVLTIAGTIVFAATSFIAS